MSEERTLNVRQSEERLDKFLTAQLDFSRSRIKNNILAGDVLVNGAAARPSDKLKAGDIVTVVVHTPTQTHTEPQDIPVDIVYQDEDIAVVNKAQGMVVHPAPGNPDGTLVNALLFALKDLSGIGGQLRPGIVHRIDKDTSGLLVVAKNDAAHTALAEQLAQKSARRVYAAIVHGNIKQDEVTVNKAIARSRKDRKKMAPDVGGKDAVTHFRVIERFGDFTLVEAELETGRTHQIRVHATSIHHPVAGDTVYGPKKPKLHKHGQMLHAKKLVLRHPGSGEEMTFTSPLPEYFEAALRGLRRGQ